MNSNFLAKAEPAAIIAARPKILCVDDEPALLESLKLMLFREYDVHIAPGGAAGLDFLGSAGPVPIVVSDMRMPEMSGAEFLHEVSQRFPLTTRVLLTGATDIQGAIDAVNRGNLFRFLLKPCDKDALRGTLQAALAHHQLISSERDLLQRTLVGSIRALTEVLGIADPNAFGRTDRLKQLALGVARVLKIEETWPIEYAALVCQLGNVSLPQETEKKLYLGLPTTARERIQIDTANSLAPKVIRHVPRLEPVLEILEDLASSHAANDPRLTPGARILHVVISYEAIERTSKTQANAVFALQAKKAEFDASAFEALLVLLGARPSVAEGAVHLRLDQIRRGMITASEVRLSNGVLLVAAGVEISDGLLARLANFAEGQLPAQIAVLPRKNE